jgi:hypothetical protein
MVRTPKFETVVAPVMMAQSNATVNFSGRAVWIDVIAALNVTLIDSMQCER